MVVFQCDVQMLDNYLDGKIKMPFIIFALNVMILH